MSVPAPRRRLHVPAKALGTIAGVVAASMVLIPSASAATTPLSPASPVVSAEVTEAPAEVEAVVTAGAAELVYGTDGELTAEVSTADGEQVTSGTVTFLLNGRTVEADVVNGIASVPVTTEDFGSEYGYPLNTGGYWFRASYTGEGHTNAEASAKLQVLPADPDLDATIAAEVEPGQTVTVEGRLVAQQGHEGQPQGNVVLLVDGEQAGDPFRVDDQGYFHAEFTAPEAPGEHTVDLQVGAHGNFTAATLSLTTTVIEIPAEVEAVVTAGAAELVYGTDGELTAEVSTADGEQVTSGTVTFLLNGRTVEADVVNGIASVPVTTEDFGSEHGYPLNTGGYWFRASYTGEGHTNAEVSAKLQVVQAPVRLEASLDQREIDAGDTIAVDGRVQALPGNDGQPHGNLQLLVDGEEVGEPIRVAEDGTFASAWTAPGDWEAGEHSIEVRYAASANFTDAATELNVTVVAPDEGPGSIWDALERLLRELLGWLGSLFGGR